MKKSRHIPDRPIAGYIIDRFQGEIVDVLADLDHEQEVYQFIDELTTLHRGLEKTERKRNKLIARLDDPELLIDFPEGSAHRIEAEDLLDQLNTELDQAHWSVSYLAERIRYHGNRVYGQRDVMADRLESGGGLERIRRDAPGILTSSFYLELFGKEEVLTMLPPAPEPDPIYSQVPF